MADGKVALVTGASRGIGKEIARGLRDAGLRVVTTSRGGSGDDHVSADLSTVAGMGDLARAVRARCDRLDVLVHDAGVFSRTRETTADGLELTFAVNHLAYVVVTRELLPLLAATGTPEDPARVVLLSSEAHRRARLDLADLQLARGYDGLTAYANSKLANLLYLRELARRLDGSPVTVNACHPGGVATGLLREYLRGRGVLGRLLAPFAGRLARSPERGADTPVWLATVPTLTTVSGGYFIDRRRCMPSRAARDDRLARALWDVQAALAPPP